jgi:hypothetical protein
VRKAALLALWPCDQNRELLVMATNDTSSAVRSAAYDCMRRTFAFEYILEPERVTLLGRGLLDRSVTVRNASRVLVASWMQGCDVEDEDVRPDDSYPPMRILAAVDGGVDSDVLAAAAKLVVLLYGLDILYHEGMHRLADPC